MMWQFYKERTQYLAPPTNGRGWCALKGNLAQALVVQQQCQWQQMSWFDGAAGISQQFSSITGQISNFTKEVLTEATQEVEGKGLETG